MNMTPSPSSSSMAAQDPNSRGGAQDDTSWTRTLEPVFTLVLTGSFLVHAACTLVMFSVEPPPPPTLPELAQRMRALLPPPVVHRANDAARPQKVAERELANPKQKRSSPLPKGQRARRVRNQVANNAPTSRDKVRDRLRESALIALIGKPGLGGSMGDVFSERSVLDDVHTDFRADARLGFAGRRVKRRRGTIPPPGACGVDCSPDHRLHTEGAVLAKGAPGPRKRAKPPRVDPVESLTSERPAAGRHVQRVLRSRRAAFQQCYEAELKQDAKLAGKLKMSFVINEGGRVEDAHAVHDGLGSPGLVRCVAKTLRRLRFESADEEFAVQNAFVFTPGG